MFGREAGEEEERRIDSIYKSAAILRDSMTRDDKSVTMSFLEGSTTLRVSFRARGARRVIISRAIVFGGC